MSSRRATTRATAITLALAALAACSGPADTVAATGATSHPASSGPSPSASATLEPPADGALPVPAYPASAIPWGEVGPGWFLVDWAEAGTTEGANVLIGPDGRVYATGATWDRTKSHAMDWVSGGLAVFQSTDPEQEEYGEYAWGDVSIVDLQSGAIEAYASGIDDPGWTWETKDGTHIGNMSGGDQTYATATKDGKELGWYCGGYARTGLSPGGKHLACLTGRADGRTDVVLAGITGPGSEQVIDTFSRNVFDYSIAGWLDADTFLLSRPAQGTYEDYGYQNPAGDGAAYFAYNVTTRKISDFTLPFSGAYREVTYFQGSHVYVARSMELTRFDFFSDAGEAIASVDCAATVGTSAWDTAHVSGDRAAVACGAVLYGDDTTAAIVLVDLASGATQVLGPVTADNAESASTGVWMFPYPEPYQ